MRHVDPDDEIYNGTITSPCSRAARMRVSGAMRGQHVMTVRRYADVAMLELGLVVSPAPVDTHGHGMTGRCDRRSSAYLARE